MARKGLTGIDDLLALLLGVILLSALSRGCVE
jgi:hypothetical protein